jgi:ABC-type nitrate/sulfonate/bicarbonate transport system permease component
MSAITGVFTRKETREPLPNWVLSLFGVVTILIVWEILAHVWLSQNKGLPTPYNVLKSIHRDGWSFYWPLIKGTFNRAWPGYLIGNGIALLLAMVVLLIPQTEKLVMQLAVASYCLPVIAIGPILTITLTGDHPMQALVALFVLFTTLVGALLGLRSADQSSLDVVSVYGGGSWQQLRRVRVIAALPSTLAALQLAAPTAILGAILGEYFGGSSNAGLGYAMINAEQALEVPRTWAIALIAALVGGIFYIAIGVVERIALPWAPRTTPGGNS